MTGETNVICPHCGIPNAIPGHLVDHRAHCGKCGRVLFAGKPLELDEKSFDRHTAESDLPVVVVFWAPWSSLSRELVRLLLEFTPRLEPRCRVARVDVEEEQNLSLRLGIQLIPALIAYVRGTERCRHTGPMDAEGLLRWIDTAAAPTPPEGRCPPPAAGGTARSARDD